MNPLFLSKLYLKILSAEFYCGNEIPPKVPFKEPQDLETGGNPQKGYRHNKSIDLIW